MHTITYAHTITRAGMHARTVVAIRTAAFFGRRMVGEARYQRCRVQAIGC